MNGKLIVSPKTEWRPHKGPQERFHRCPAYEVAFGGAKGPGKTESLVMEALRYVENPRYKGIIFRRTYPRLKEVIDRCYQRYPAIGGKYNGADHMWKFPRGATVTLGHCQSEEDKYIYQGHEYQYMGFDQIEEFTLTQYEFLKAQNRSGVPGLKPYVRATTNPGGIGHGWVKRRFVTNFLANEIYEDENGLTRCFIPSKIYDNPTLMKADPGYVNRLKSLPEKLRQALLEGNWDVFEGQYFTEWSIEKHVCKPFKIPPSWKRYISLDYGFAKPSAIYWYAIDYHEKVHVIWEYYNEQRTYAQLAEIIKLISKGQKIEYLVADPAIWGDKAHHKDQEEGVSGAEVLQDALENKDKGKNIDVVKADNNRNTGWIRFRQYLLNEQFVAFNTCKNFIRTVPDLIHDEHKEEDLDTNGEDHSADSVRYFLMSRSDAPVRKIPEKKITDGYAEELTRMEMGVGTGYMGA